MLKNSNYNFKIKMFATKNMDLQHYCGDLSESIDYLQEQIGNESPIFKNNLLSFRSFPKNMPNYSSEKELIDVMNMEEEVINQKNNNSQKYKCFKCFGTDRHMQVVNQYGSNCDECEGTEYISESHGLAYILQQVLMLKFPALNQKQNQLKKEDAKKFRQLSNLFGSQNSIQQQQPCSYYWDETSRQCNSCCSQLQSYKMYGCKQCKDYFVCKICYQRKKYSHSADHELIFPQDHLISLRICPTTMKKISQEGQLQDSSNYLDSSQLIVINCQNCNQLIQQCYQVCLDCQQQGVKFIICAQCSENDNYFHQHTHQLDMRTLKQASKLLRLSNKPSVTESQATQPTPSKSKIKTKQSLIRFDDFQPEQSEDKRQSLYTIQKTSISDFSQSNQQLLQTNCRDSLMASEIHHQQDFSHLLVKKKVKKMQKIEVSVVNIDMQCSIQAPSMQQDFTPTIIPYAFSNTSNQILERKSNNNPQQYVFNDYQCDICNTLPIKNKRYHCKECDNYDLCEMCYLLRSKRHQHKDYEIIDGLQILKKNRESLINKMELNKHKISLTRGSMTRTRISEFSSFK